MVNLFYEYLLYCCVFSLSVIPLIASPIIRINGRRDIHFPLITAYRSLFWNDFCINLTITFKEAKGWGLAISLRPSFAFHASLAQETFFHLNDTKQRTVIAIDPPVWLFEVPLNQQQNDEYSLLFFAQKRANLLNTCSSCHTISPSI